MKKPKLTDIKIQTQEKQKPPPETAENRKNYTQWHLDAKSNKKLTLN